MERSRLHSRVSGALHALLAAASLVAVLAPSPVCRAQTPPRPKPLDDAPPPPAPPPPDPEVTQPLMRGALIWQGFNHQWVHHPHRLGDFRNTVFGWGSPGAPSIGRRRARFLPGQDGDSADVRTYARAVNGPGLHTYQGAWTVLLDDQIDSTPAQFAQATYNAQVTIPLPAVPGSIDAWAVVLRGIDMDLTQGTSPSTGYIWPTVLDVNLGECTRAASTITCPLAVHVERKDSPDGKQSVERIHYRISVPYSLVVGTGGALRATPPDAIAVTKRNLNSGPETKTNIHAGLDASYNTAVTAITGYRFQLRSTSKLWPLKEGRFLTRHDFHVEDQTYAAGSLVRQATLGIWRKDDALGYAAEFDATLRTRILQLRAKPGCADATTQEVNDRICIQQGAGPACAVIKEKVENTLTRPWAASCW